MTPNVWQNLKVIGRKVIRAKVSGFCMGVRRAVDIARLELKRSGKVYAFGPLIHNQQALDDLKRRGLETLNEAALPDDLNGAVVIIRAHGAGPQTEEELHKRGAFIVDATCPKVKMSQMKAAAFSNAGYWLFLAGEETHAEISGIRGCFEAGGNDCLHIVNNCADAEKAAAKLFSQAPDAKTALIGQTTISSEEYQSIGQAITRYFPNTEIVQTICAATKERQDSLKALLEKVDAVIIAGGKASANTRRLYDIAAASGKPSILAESANDIPPEFLKYKTIGLSAGASTPDFVIEEIEGACV